MFCGNSYRCMLLQSPGMHKKKFNLISVVVLVPAAAAVVVFEN